MHMCFFFNDTATTEIYTLSLHDALPICRGRARHPDDRLRLHRRGRAGDEGGRARLPTEAGGLEPPAAPRRARARTHRSEEHTSELQSRQYLVCRLLLEKKIQRHPLTHTY